MSKEEQNKSENLENLDEETKKHTKDVLEELINKEEESKKSEADQLVDSKVDLDDSSLDGYDGATAQSGLVSEDSRIEPRILENEMRTSYLNYAMSVIVSRALPDVRDGMKPVHRRIMYTMHKMNLTPSSKYIKCARVVGDALGKYHPHGDASVYNALARLAQDFSMRYQLVDGQGNFGSIDGDSPAAMRYTECRMGKPAPYLLADIDKDTVDFVDNYDGSRTEPSVLPAQFPNLLVNGQTGIAVGMATEIPPHNLQEVISGLLHLLDNPDATVEDLAEYIKGPDLPTGGIIYGHKGILEGYKTGRGKCTVRAKTELTENSIIVTEIPYQVNKSEMLIKIASLVKDKRVEGIRDIRDESNKDGIRVVIDTKRDASPEVVLNLLFKMTELQKSIHFNTLALVNKGRQPKLLNLREILTSFLAHRDEVVIRRTKFILRKAEAELHILDGLKVALDNIDRVIELIRSSYDKAEAAERLQKEFDLSEIQSEAILQMRLQTLTNMDKSKIEQDRQTKLDLIKELKEILENPEVKKALIAGELEEVKKKFPSQRRSKLIDYSVSDYNKEDFIEDEEVLIQLTNEQYIKYVPSSVFRQQGRGGRGVSSFNPKDEDFVKQSMLCNTHDYLYAFTNLGRVFRVRVFDLPSGSRNGRGQNLVNYLELQKDEKISNILTISKEQEDDKEGSLLFATKNGIVKRTKLELYNNIRKTGIIAINLKEGDELVRVQLSSDPKDKVILSADNGKTVIFDKGDLNTIGRTAAGVKGMKLKPDDSLISMQISNFNFSSDEESSTNALIEDPKEKKYPSLLVVTANGYGKQTYLADYRKTKRAASGVKTLNMTKKTGKAVLVRILTGEEESLIVTTKKGVTINVDPTAISQLGRSTQGVKTIRLDKNDLVVSGGVN